MKMSHKVSFREYGHGPILILLHGYGGSVMHWDPVVDQLKTRYRVVVPNMTHLYMSQDRLLFPVIVEKVRQFIEGHFPSTKVSVAGMSFGGAIAWGLALRHPHLIERVLLFNPLVADPVPKFLLPEVRYFFVMPMDRAAIVRAFGSPIGQAFLSRAGEIFRPGREQTSHPVKDLVGRKLEFVAQMIAHFSWILRNEDWEHWESCMNECSVPILVAWAKDDQLFDPKYYFEFAEKIRSTHKATIDVGGHILTAEHSGWVVQQIQEFMDERRRFRRSAA